MKRINRDLASGDIKALKFDVLKIDLNIKIFSKEKKVALIMLILNKVWNIWIIFITFLFWMQYKFKHGKSKYQMKINWRIKILPNSEISVIDNVLITVSFVLIKQSF